MSSYHLDHLAYLETEAIHVLREVAAEFERRRFCFPAAKIPSASCVWPRKRSGLPRFRCHFSTWKRGMNFRS